MSDRHDGLLELWGMCIQEYLRLYGAGSMYLTVLLVPYVYLSPVQGNIQHKP